MMGTELEIEKSEFGRLATSMGPGGYFPWKPNIYQMSVTMGSEKATEWAAHLRNYIEAGAISSNELGNIIGKLGAPQDKPVRAIRSVGRFLGPFIGSSTAAAISLNSRIWRQKSSHGGRISFFP